MTITIEHDVPARMRDGVILRANVYRPSGPGPWPVLLTRTPYDKNAVDGHVWCGIDPVEVARQGFIVVIQDTRGRFTSDGEWDPLTYERDDGVDTIAWAAALEGSNGRVGMYGGSYCGYTQLAPATEQPPDLYAIAPTMTWSDPMDGLFARGGATELGTALVWSLGQGFEYFGRTGRDSDQLEELIQEWDRLDEDGYWQLPVPRSPVLERHAVPELGSIAASEDPATAQHACITGAHHRITVPSLHTTGWFDNLLQGTLDNYMGVSEAGAQARLVVGPWTHAQFEDPIGERRFGLRGGRDTGPAHPHGTWKDFQIAWLGQQLRPDSEVDFPQTPVRIFVMGRNEWRDEAQWPLARAVSERWFLHADKRLDPESPDDAEPITTFEYDPADPVPTVGGNFVMSPGYVAGPMDQRRVEARDDVLVFTSQPLDSDLEVTGRVRVVLHAESSAPSTDWVARLCDVMPDGRSFNVCDGILRVTAGADALDRYEIDLWSTSMAFLVGHRLRVVVTSSSFPRWDRNLNTGAQHEPRFVVAKQRVCHDAQHASWIELPVVRSS